MSCRLHVVAKSESIAVFVEGRRLFAGSSYDVRVDAPEFAEDQASSASVSLCSGPVVLASAALVPDPLRRGVRTSSAPLAVPAVLDGSGLRLRVELAGDTILLVGQDVAGASGSQPSADPSDGWTVADIGTVSSGTVSVADRTQVKMVASPGIGTLSIVPSQGSFDAYLFVTVPAGSDPGFPFSGVLVSGSAPTWTHQDSFSAPARKWILHVVKVADEYCADLRAGIPAGTELDPDGDLVVSAEVNR